MKIHTSLRTFLITLILLITVRLNSDAQNMPLSVKNIFFEKQKQNLKDTK